MKLKINNDSYNFIPCRTFLSKFRGLMFSKKKNLMFYFPLKERPLIHMFFVFYPITVICLDEFYKILEYKYIYPFTFFLPKYKAKYILEVPKRIEANKVYFVEKVHF
tara:strand:- start:164 stop:484 length:321 start_codon:yes stop_codon:yes gene_type:complete